MILRRGLKGSNAGRGSERRQMTDWTSRRGNGFGRPAATRSPMTLGDGRVGAARAHRSVSSRFHSLIRWWPTGVSMGLADVIVAAKDRDLQLWVGWRRTARHR